MKPARSLRAAINAMCKHCLYDPGNGNGAWREQIDRCSSSNCPLHAVRPRSSGERIKKAVSSPENALDAPDPADDAETSLSALLGAAFGHHGAVSE